MSNFLDLDFEATIRDYDYTRRAASGINQVITSADFENCDSDMIMSFLMNQMELVSFKDYLKRYLYEQSGIGEPFREVPPEVYADIISTSFEENSAPHSFTPTTKRWSAAIKKWLTLDSVHRSTVFLLGFGLGMEDTEVSEFLTKVLREEDFNERDPEEVIFRYCYHTHSPYSEALRLKQTYDSLTGDANTPISSWEAFLQAEAFSDHPEDDFLSYLRHIKKINEEGSSSSILKQEFNALYSRVQTIIANIYNEEADNAEKSRVYKPEDITPADVEKVLCCGIPVNESGNQEKMSASLLAKHFNQRRVTRMRLHNILTNKADPDRFDLITLCFYIYAETVEPDWPTERYLRFLDEMNDILKRCHMMELYPANPYEAFILMCLLADSPVPVYADIWEMSFQQ